MNGREGYGVAMFRDQAWLRNLTFDTYEEAAEYRDFLSKQSTKSMTVIKWRVLEGTQMNEAKEDD